MNMDIIKKAYVMTIMAGMRTLDSIVPQTMRPEIEEMIEAEKKRQEEQQNKYK